MLSNSAPRESDSRRIHAIALSALLLLLVSAPVWPSSDLPEVSESAPPARIELIDQSVVSGEITHIRDGELYFATESMGGFNIALSSTLYLESDQDIELLTTEPEKLTSSSIMVADGEVVLEVAAEATADYDGGAAHSKEKLDETLKFQIGYTW